MILFWENYNSFGIIESLIVVDKNSSQVKHTTLGLSSPITCVINVLLSNFAIIKKKKIRIGIKYK